MRFVDTSFWAALFLEEDAHHASAARLWREMSGPLLSTDLVLGETWTFVRRRGGHDAAVRVVDALTGSARLTVVRAGAAVEDDAWEWLHRHDEREYSFVDATSFAVMRRRRLREACAFDGDFAAAGFVEVRPS